MKTKITAGAELDLLTAGEVRDVLKNWMHEITRGAKYTRRAALATPAADGSLTLTDPQNFGPAEGFVWAITRIAVGGFPSGQTIDLYVNTVSISSVVATNVGASARLAYGSNALVLQSGETLIGYGATGFTAGNQYSIVLGIKEVPALMVWAL